jgi:periplasmic protein TonB
LGHGTEAGLFSRSLIISVGLHLALATVILLGLGSHQPVSPPVLTVSLLAPDPGLPGPGATPGPAGAQADRAVTPSAPPAPAKKQANLAPKAKEKPLKRKAKHIARYEPEEAWPEIPVRPALSPVVKAPSAPAPAALPPAASPARVTATGWSSGISGQTAGQRGVGVVTGGSGSASGGLGRGGGGGNGGGSGGRSLAEAQRHYLSIVRTRILAKRQYPPISRQRHEEGVVRLRFTLSPAGALSQGVQMVKPSGYHLLDNQARQCVLAASPFPPFPPDLQRDCLTVEVPIVYKLTELGM